MNTISSLTIADLSEAIAIEKASHAFPWSKATFESNQGEHYLNLKLELAEKIVAFAITQVVLDEATLFNLAVHPQWQRQGLGHKLLLALIEQLTARGIMTLWLEVRASNRAAIALYEKIGFNEVTVRRGYYPAAQGREDAIVMALTLG